MYVSIYSIFTLGHYDPHSQLSTEHIGCFEHTLQLTIQDGLRNDLL